MIQKVEHPSTFIDQSSLEIIRKTAFESERLNDLHPDQLKLIYERKWFKMFVPEEYGGLGWSLPKVLKTEESLSWADGSTGWVVTLCGGAGWFSGFLQPSLLKEILSGDDVCFAGSGAVTGIANKTQEGYRVTGQWKYASGSLHATVFTANCILHREGVGEYNGDGSPCVAPFLFLKDEVVLHAHWKSMGMVATGSHSFEVKELLIPANRRFTIEGKHALLNLAVYQYPFMQLAETTLAVNVSGMAMHFLDLCGELFSEKMKHRNGLSPKGPDLYEMLARTKAALDKYRDDFYAAADRSWEICARRDVLPRGVLNQVSKTSDALAHGAIRLVDELYPYCGLVAADPRTEINRVWRDLHTASQHALFSMGLK